MPERVADYFYFKSSPSATTFERRKCKRDLIATWPDTKVEIKILLIIRKVGSLRVNETQREIKFLWNKLTYNKLKRFSVSLMFSFLLNFVSDPPYIATSTSREKLNCSSTRKKGFWLVAKVSYCTAATIKNSHLSPNDSWNFFRNSTFYAVQ